MSPQGGHKRARGNREPLRKDALLLIYDTGKQSSLGKGACFLLTKLILPKAGSAVVFEATVQATVHSFT